MGVIKLRRKSVLGLVDFEGLRGLPLLFEMVSASKFRFPRTCGGESQNQREEAGCEKVARHLAQRPARLRA